LTAFVLIDVFEKENKDFCSYQTSR